MTSKPCDHFIQEAKTSLKISQQWTILNKNTTLFLVSWVLQQNKWHKENDGKKFKPICMGHHVLLLYIWTSVWVLRTPNAG